MPRYDGNSAPGSRSRRHHKSMNSASHGKGGDRKIKKEKQVAGQSKKPAPRKRKREEDLA